MDSNPFWEFSLDFYSREEVSRLCLELQDNSGYDVNLVLFCIWYGRRFGEIEQGVLDRAIEISRQWRQPVVAPLREIRRRMRSLAGNFQPRLAEAREALRNDVKELELRAEQLQQAMLYQLVEDRRASRSHSRPGAISANLLKLQSALAPAGCADTAALAELLSLAEQPLPQAR